MNDLVTRETIQQFQAVLSSMPQVELPTEHFHLPGVYIRKMSMVAGTTLVGKVHRAPHMFICAAGEIVVVDTTGRHVMRAGDVVESPAGTKRAIHATVDSVCINVHRTDEVDLDKIEEELIEPDHSARFNAFNRLKELT